MDVIAESVETLEQQQWLRNAGCKEVQGHLYGKPMAAGEITHLILTGASGIAA